MAWIIAGIGGLYLLDQAYTVVYDNTVKPIGEWMDQREKERLEQERRDRERNRLERHEALIQRHNEIRERFGIPKRNNYERKEVECWTPWS